MKDRWIYLGLALAALGTGFGLWTVGRPRATPPVVSTPSIGAASVYATSFIDEAGQPQPLGQFQGRVLLLNFWATWCAPCREEMPLLSDAARRWGDRGVTIVGLSAEPAETIGDFRRKAALAYALWSGGAAVAELGRRLGNTSEVLPYSVLMDRTGKVVDQRVGPYSADELEALLSRTTANGR
jgi:thiol-disulfide isomerase/thioredoxin